MPVCLSIHSCVQGVHPDLLHNRCASRPLARDAPIELCSCLSAVAPVSDVMRVEAAATKAVEKASQRRDALAMRVAAKAVRDEQRRAERSEARGAREAKPAAQELSPEEQLQLALKAAEQHPMEDQALLAVCGCRPVQRVRVNPLLARNATGSLCKSNARVSHRSRSWSCLCHELDLLADHHQLNDLLSRTRAGLLSADAPRSSSRFSPEPVTPRHASMPSALPVPPGTTSARAFACRY